MVCGSEVLEAVAAASADGQDMVDTQSVSQRCRVRVDRAVAQSAGPAVGVGDQLPQPLPVTPLPACPAHAPEYTPSYKHPANQVPPVRDTPGPRYPRLPQPGLVREPGPGSEAIAPSPRGDERRVRRIAAGGPARSASPSCFLSKEIEGSSKGERVSLMETLSLREMIWLALSSAWTDASLDRHSGANPWIFHAEHCSFGSDMGQWRERSAWSEEGIGGIPSLIRGAGRLGPGIL